MKRPLAAALLAAVVVGAASGCGAKPAEGPMQIVYAAGGDEGSRHAGLFLTDDEGRNHRRLTRAPGPAAFQAEWSPAGDAILLEVQTMSGGEIWTMKPDGTGIRHVAEGLAASWSPDGSELAVVDDRKGFISIFGADGAPLRQIDLGLEEDHFVELAPAWSPDGAELALSVSSIELSGSRIVTVAADGKEPPRPLGEVRDGMLEEHPTWSPDGSLIAFHRLEEEGDSSVWIMRADGSGRRLVARDCGPPVWSLDGESLLCESTAPGEEGILAYPLAGGPSRRVGHVASGLYESRGRFRHGLRRHGVSWRSDGARVAYVDDAGRAFTSRPDGSDRRQLTDPGEDGMPDWSPDGSEIAFVRGSDGDAEVFVVGADGQGERRIAAGSGPAWSPSGAQLLIGVTRGKRAGFAVVTMHPLRVGEMVAGDSPVWSPDGETVAFLKHLHDSDAETSVPMQSALYLMSRDGRMVRKVAATGGPDEPRVFDIPAWSPDGESILIAEHDPMSGAAGRLRRVHVNGGGQETIARDDSSALDQLTLSPDGERATFVTEGPAAEIATIDLEHGTRKTLAAFDRAAVVDLAWSPDREQLGYVALLPEEESFVLYVMNADGTDRRRISRPPEPVTGFDWRRS